MSEKKIKLLNALRAKNTLTEEELEKLQELEAEYLAKEDIMTEFFNDTND